MISPFPGAKTELAYVKQRLKESLNVPRHEKTCVCMCENKVADQLRGNYTADQHLCFRYMDNPSTF